MLSHFICTIATMCLLGNPFERCCYKIIKHEPGCPWQITCNGTSCLILMRSNAPYGIVIVLVPFYRWENHEKKLWGGKGFILFSALSLPLNQHPLRSRHAINTVTNSMDGWVNGVQSIAKRSQEEEQKFPTRWSGFSYTSRSMGHDAAPARDSCPGNPFL